MTVFMNQLCRWFWGWWAGSWFYPEQLEKLSIRRSVAALAPKITGTLLDVGCGEKPYKSLFPAVENYIGLEYPPARLQEWTNATADVWAEAQSLPIQAGKADAILSTQVLEHLPDPVAFFHESFRVLRPGGILILTTNQEWGIHKAPYDFYRYTRYGLEYLARNAGLRIVALEARGGFWVMMGQRIAAYLFDRWVARFRKNHKIVFLLSFICLCPVVALAQLAALAIDGIDHIEENTIGYFMEAQKPTEGGCE